MTLSEVAASYSRDLAQVQTEVSRCGENQAGFSAALGRIDGKVTQVSADIHGFSAKLADITTAAANEYVSHRHLNKSIEDTLANFARSMSPVNTQTKTQLSALELTVSTNSAETSTQIAQLRTDANLASQKLESCQSQLSKLENFSYTQLQAKVLEQRAQLDTQGQKVKVLEQEVLELRKQYATTAEVVELRRMFLELQTQLVAHTGKVLDVVTANLGARKQLP
jgi:malonyl CoA-acyl carrier protein transacylase